MVGGSADETVLVTTATVDCTLVQSRVAFFDLLFFNSTFASFKVQ